MGTALLITSAQRPQPCEEKLHRWAGWAAALSHRPHFDVHLLHDGSTSETAALQALLDARVKPVARIQVSRMVEERVVLSRFAGMRWGGFSQGGGRKLLYKIHFPALLFWWEGVSERYEHVWSVEHDAFYGGDIASFLNRYATVDADLVDAFAQGDANKVALKMGRQGHSRTSALAGEVSLNLSSAQVRTVDEADHNLGWALPERLRLMKHEHVERFSRRLLLTLRDVAELRLSALGELFESSVCNALSWCTMRDLHRDGFIQPRAWAYRGAQFNMCLDSEDPSRFGPVWTHKWLCTCAQRPAHNRSGVSDGVHGPASNFGLQRVPSHAMPRQHSAMPDADAASRHRSRSKAAPRGHAAPVAMKQGE